jgi:hypothetical protein
MSTKYSVAQLIFSDMPMPLVEKAHRPLVKVISATVYLRVVTRQTKRKGIRKYELALGFIGTRVIEGCPISF